MFRGKIIGVRDFISSKGKFMRQIFVISDGLVLEGLVGQECFMIWAEDEFKQYPVQNLVGSSCTLVTVHGNTAILGLDFLESKAGKSDAKSS